MYIVKKIFDTYMVYLIISSWNMLKKPKYHKMYLTLCMELDYYNEWKEEN